MKKLLTLLVAISLMLFALTGCDIINNIIGGGNNGGNGGNNGGGGNPAYDDTKCSEGLAFAIDDSGNYAVSGYTGEDETVYVPASYEGKPVVSIATNAFKNNAVATRLYLPQTITSICTKAFENASALTSVIFYEEPETFTIGASAFSGCSSLKNFTIPASTYRIGSKAFGGCSKLQTIEGAVTYVGKWAVACDTNESSGSVKTGTVGIADTAFTGCSFASITLPSTLKYIGDTAFMRASQLTSVTVPASGALEVIGKEAFAECSALTSVQLSAKIKTIGEKVFFKCPSLETLTIPENSETFSSPKNAFLVDKTTKTLVFACHRLGTTIPNDGSIEYIGAYAFFENTLFQGPTFPASIKGIGEYAFSRATKITEFNVPANAALEYIGDFAFYKASLRTMTFGEGSKLREIGNEAFRDANISRFAIPASVEKLGTYCLANNWSMIKVTFDEGCQLTKIPEGFLYAVSGVKEIYIPDSVTTIGKAAFYGLYNLVSVYIPDTVTTIEGGAFDHFTGHEYKMMPTLYCEAVDKPAGWAENWVTEKVLAEVVWGYVGT